MATQGYPDGHHFVVLNVSINKTAVFVSAVVIFKKSALSLENLVAHLREQGVALSFCPPDQVRGASEIK